MDELDKEELNRAVSCDVFKKLSDKHYVNFPPTDDESSMWRPLREMIAGGNIMAFGVADPLKHAVSDLLRDKGDDE